MCNDAPPCLVGNEVSAHRVRRISNNHDDRVSEDPARNYSTLLELLLLLKLNYVTIFYHRIL